MRIEEILTEKIDWSYLGSEKHIFFALLNNTILHLILNDFPEEPLCTLKIGNNKYDLWDFPKNWTLPLHRIADPVAK